MPRRAAIAAKVAGLGFVLPASQAIADGDTPAQALKLGDNGVGYWGDDTTSTTVPMCALPRDDWLTKWGKGSAARGKGVLVTYKGKTVTAQLRDTMPSHANIKNGAGIDLNPGLVDAFGLKYGGMYPGFHWDWANT